MIVDEVCDRPSHWRSEKQLNTWLVESGIPAICGVDTRTLTKHIRKSGTLLGKIINATDVDKNFSNVVDPNKINLIKDVSISVSTIDGFLLFTVSLKLFKNKYNYLINI